MVRPSDSAVSPDARLLALMADRTHNAVIIADATGHIQWVNAGFTRITGYALSEVAGHRPGTLLQGPQTDPATVAFMRTRLRAGEGFRTEVLNYRKDGTAYWLGIDVQPVRDDAGSITHFIAIEQDISERKRAEEKLACALALQTAILDHAAACVISVDPTGTVVTFNRAAERELGYAADEVIGRHTVVLFHDPAELEMRAAERAVQLGRPASFDDLFRADDPNPTANQWTFVRKDGTRFPAELTVTTLRDPAGRPIGYVGLATNIARRFEAERTQRELSRRLAEQNAALEEQSRLAALQAEVGLTLNRDVSLAEVLRGCCEAILRNTGAAFVRAWTLNAAADVLELQASAGMYTHIDGGHARVPVGQFKIGRIASTRTPHLTNDVPHDPNVDRTWAMREGMVAFAGHPLVCGGELVGVLALFARSVLSEGALATLRAAADALAMGIARKRAEADVREQERRHRTIVECALDCIVTTDADGRVTEFNPAAERTFGYSRDEAVGRELAGLIVPSEHRDGTPNGLENYLRTGEPKILGTRVVGLLARRKEGTQFPIELSIVPTRVGGEMAFTAFFRDITAEQAAETKRREAEQQLQKAKEAAESAARTQSQFLANMSHELRTPIAAIVGYAEMLLDPRLEIHERVRSLQTIMRSGRHLTALINDVLDLGKIDAERMELERTSCRLRPLVLEAVAQADIAAREKQLTLRFVPVGRLPAALTTDPTRLRQILDNLLSNAVKFTEPGRKVEFRLRCEDERTDGPRLIFEVDDEGIGIAPEALARLFQPFTQADASTTRRYGGTGLGLSICKRLAGLMGGAIAVRSTPGVGTCFTLTLPVTEADMNDLVDKQEFAEDACSVLATETAPPKLSGRVLLAEDTITIQTVLRYFLERGGLTVEVADNGRQAVERARATEFDVILMDMQMPEMDGYAATSALRQSGYGRAIVALTAHAMTGDEEKCLRAGCNAYLTKPVDAVRLLRIVEQHLPSRSWAVKYDTLRRALPAPVSVSPPPTLPNGAGGGAASRMDKLTADYRRALPEKARLLGVALREGNVVGLSELAHRLRGSAGMYGFPQVSEAAGRVEDACRAGRAEAELAELVVAFEETCATTCG